MGERFERTESDYLLPPSGDNLMSILMAKKELRSVSNDVFLPTGLRVGLRAQEQKIELIKDFEDIVVSYPYGNVSDTMLRQMFYLSAIVSNSGSVLVFEEPESHAFPHYIKYLAETIALDEHKTQYFLSTHNPYFLMPLIGKTLQEELGVFVTYTRDYQTKVRQLSNEEVSEWMEDDIFGNLDIILDEE